MSAALRIACKGLTSHEQGLLTQQLKMLKGRTAQSWVYVEDTDQVELLIVRDHDEYGQCAQVQRRIGAHLQPACAIEWPLRLFGLLELLAEYEKQPQPDNEAIAGLCEQLAALSVHRFYHVGDELIVVPRDDLVLTRCSDFASTLQYLAAFRGDPEPYEMTALGEGCQFTQRFSFRSLLWSLALMRGEQLGGDFRVADMVFRLDAWPLLNEWQSSPALVRMAALFTRQFASIERGVAFSGASRQQVQAFLFACKCCGIGLQTRVQRQGVSAPVAVEKTLLQRLRLRLGLG